MCPKNLGLSCSRRQAVLAFGGSPSLSWSEPPSRSNLPKDPPSKTATLHKKDDTDTLIIFKSCGTACWPIITAFLKVYSKLPVPHLFCGRPKTWSTTTWHIWTYFAHIPNVAQWLRGAPGLWRTKSSPLGHNWQFPRSERERAEWVQSEFAFLFIFFL